MEKKLTANNEGRGRQLPKKDPSTPFVKDMEPYFYGRNITYVDVGAYRGDVLRALVHSRIRVREAHLLEPNPQSFCLLEEQMAQVKAVRHLSFHNVAVSDSHGTLGLRKEGTMSSVVSDLPDAIEGVNNSIVDVKSVTLDSFAEQCGLDHISILKVDVEGHELKVLAGAARLLGAAAVDVIYIEVGFNPDNRKQTSLGRIESHLAKFGYRIFKIYEQKNEWIDDSPLLRRANVAFMHQMFAEQNPHQVRRELFRSRLREEEVAAELKKTQEELAQAEAERHTLSETVESQRRLEGELQALRAAKALVDGELLGLRQTAGQRIKDLSKLVERQRQTVRELNDLSKEHKALAAYAEELELRYEDILTSTSWRITSPLRSLLARIKGLMSGELQAAEWRPRYRFHGKRKGGENAARARRMVRSMRRRMLELGFVETGHARLVEWANDSSQPCRARFAARELVVWHLNQGGRDHAEQASRFLPVMMSGERSAEWLRRMRILEVELYSQLGEGARARELVEQLVQEDPHPDVFLASANLASDVQDRVAGINAALQSAGLETITLRQGDLSPYDRIEVDPKSLAACPSGDTLVTVIMPAYNGGRVIGTALRSLVSQTWKNFELLVVDDRSTDDTEEIVQSFARLDPRIRLIKAPVNAGPYVARNIALDEARGEFVTCHDADDWSHPRKLEIQAKHLIEHPWVVANLAMQARATDDLKFNRRGNFGYYCYANLSSLMFRRRPVGEKLGYWDSVRFMADGEFQRRLEREFGSTSVEVIDSALTSFQRSSGESLTESSAYGYPGHLMGARREYYEASYQHHRIADSVRYTFPQTERPFAVPRPMHPARSGSGDRHFDVIIASDFRLVGGSTLSSIEEVKAQAAAGLRTGLVQMSRFDMDPGQRRMNRKLRSLINEGAAEVLVYGEKVSCDLLIIRYPPVLQHRQRYLPSISARSVKVIVNQPPMSDYGPDAMLRYEIPKCAKWLEELFGTSGVWHPIGPAVRDALHLHHAGDLSAIDLAEEDWVNIIDVAQWRRKARPSGNRRPRIGRHARDHQVKWPGSRKELLTVYPDSEKYEVYVMGGGEVPRQILGGQLPPNWTVVPFDGLSPREYLSDLDVFVYYTHSDWVESFGRVIIEAMAVGVPVILPPSYRELFQDAAIYAEPDDVLDCVDNLMADPALYQSRVDHALDFVDRKFGYSMHVRRINAAAKKG